MLNFFFKASTLVRCRVWLSVNIVSYTNNIWWTINSQSRGRNSWWKNLQKHRLKKEYSRMSQMYQQEECKVGSEAGTTDCACSLSCVQLFVTPWSIASQAPLSLGFSQQGYWSGLPFPPPGELPWSRHQTHVSCIGRQIFATEPSGNPTTDCSVQFISVAQSCPTLCNPMNHSTPGLPVHHQLPELAQTHVHQIGGAVQPSYPLLSLSPPAFSLAVLPIRWPKY